jgi:energy-coupling factor transporter ATP-binding protein EcfA2
VGITVRGLTFRYPGAARPALQDISLAIPDGAFCGIIGANGAGKSTLCNTFIGFVPHFYRGDWAGEVTVNGHSVVQGTIGDLAHQVGFVFQNPFDQLTGAAATAFEEVAFGLEQRGVSPAEIERRARAALAAVGLAGQADRHPFFLSGGQQQRLAIAAVLALEPPILVLDEATSQLDPVGTAEVFALAARLHQEGRTIVMVEHKLDWLARYAQQVLVLHQGRLVLAGPPERVLADPRLPEWDLRHPTCVALGMALRERGRWDGPLPLTLKQAEAGLRRWLP